MKSSSKPKRVRVPILMYHEVCGERDEAVESVRHTNPAYILPVSRFYEQMKHIHNNGFQTLTLDDLTGRDSFSVQKRILITFDDGFYNNYNEVFPIMKSLGQKANIFVVAGFIGQDRYMDWSQLREMNSKGFLIGSHGMSHRPLTEMAEPEAKDELEKSKKIIEDGLGHAVRFVSLPHGMMNKTVIQLARKAGYVGLCTSKPLLNHCLNHIYVFNRINIPERLALSVFARIARGSDRTVKTMWLKKVLKDTAKKGLGYKCYRKLYQLRYRIEA